jgi:hypothetical protein
MAKSISWAEKTEQIVYRAVVSLFSFFKIMGKDTEFGFGIDNWALICIYISL